MVGAQLSLQETRRQPRLGSSRFHVRAVSDDTGRDKTDPDRGRPVREARATDGPQRRVRLDSRPVKHVLRQGQRSDGREVHQQLPGRRRGGTARARHTDPRLRIGVEQIAQTVSRREHRRAGRRRQGAGQGLVPLFDQAVHDSQVRRVRIGNDSMALGGEAGASLGLVWVNCEEELFDHLRNVRDSRYVHLGTESGNTFRCAGFCEWRRYQPSLFDRMGEIGRHVVQALPRADTGLAGDTADSARVITRWLTLESSRSAKVVLVNVLKVVSSALTFGTLFAHTVRLWDPFALGLVGTAWSVTVCVALGAGIAVTATTSKLRSSRANLGLAVDPLAGVPFTHRCVVVFALFCAPTFTPGYTMRVAAARSRSAERARGPVARRDEDLPRSRSRQARRSRSHGLTGSAR
ncbi:hypothetical protein Q5P01_016604 [Channa striata]|uniref:Uncharacterized protein n=1 Tax=Channa striata TaxID=64152 RepID=A0AA88SBT2_CHASR|nr:hypothetical protein Q5P01_016604 [Channa striata]